MADIQINTPAPTEQGANTGPGSMLAIILAVVLGAALVWYFVGYRPTSSTTVAPTNPGTTINVNVPPVTINSSSGSNTAPVPTAGSSTAPARPAAGSSP
jgi:hypothetical protein